MNEMWCKPVNQCFYCAIVNNPLLASAHRGLCFTIAQKTIDYPIHIAPCDSMVSGMD